MGTSEAGAPGGGAKTPRSGLFWKAYQALLGEQLIFGRERKDRESDRDYEVRQAQEETLAELVASVASGQCQIPRYTPEEQAAANANARIYEANRKSAVHKAVAE